MPATGSHIQMEGILLQQHLGVLIINRFPVHADAQNVGQLREIGVKGGQMPQHVSARFVEKEGLDDGQLALVFFLMSLFNDPVKEQPNSMCQAYFI